MPLSPSPRHPVLPSLLLETGDGPQSRPPAWLRAKHQSIGWVVATRGHATGAYHSVELEDGHEHRWLLPKPRCRSGGVSILRMMWPGRCHPPVMIEVGEPAFGEKGIVLRCGFGGSIGARRRDHLVEPPRTTDDWGSRTENPRPGTMNSNVTSPTAEAGRRGDDVRADCWVKITQTDTEVSACSLRPTSNRCTANRHAS